MKVTCVVDNAVCDHSSFWGEHGTLVGIHQSVGRQSSAMIIRVKAVTRLTD